VRAVQHGRRRLETAGADHRLEALQIVQGEFDHVSFIYRDCPIFVISTKTRRDYALPHSTFQKEFSS
jgi:hypothetical protein